MRYLFQITATALARTILQVSQKTRKVTSTSSTYLRASPKLAQGIGFSDIASKKMLAKNFSSEPLDFKEIIATWPSVDRASEIPFVPSLWIRIIKHFRPVKGPHLPERMKINMEGGQFVLDNIYDSGLRLRWRIPKRRDE